MIQLEILSGKMAGTTRVARRFPFRIGRSANADLRFEEEGVWDEHLQIAFDAARGFALSALGDALVAVNGKSCRDLVLANGDEMAIGALKIRFWLSPVPQANLWLREWLTWIGIALVTALQIYLVYRLAP